MLSLVLVRTAQAYWSKLQAVLSLTCYTGSDILSHRVVPCPMSLNRARLNQEVVPLKHSQDMFDRFRVDTQYLQTSAFALALVVKQPQENVQAHRPTTSVN